MLGIFLIICMGVFFFIEFKEYCLLREDFVEHVTLDNVGREYEVCHRAGVLRSVSALVMLVGYLGCVWPYAFVEGIDTGAHVIVIVAICIPMFFISFLYYLSIKNGQGFIRISTDEIEYKRHKSFTVKVSNIKKISYTCLWSYQIHLKEKGKQPLDINLIGFYKKKELNSLMQQLSDHCAKLSGRDKSLAHKFNSCKFNTILNRYYLVIWEILAGGALLYGSYCCIDYDFFRKDYTAELNVLGAISGESENAWEHYVQAAKDYVEMEGDFQKIIMDGLKPGELNLTDEQVGKLRKWYDENTSSWASLKEATSIDYCNAAYENISLNDGKDREDFSSVSYDGYRLIKYLYCNINACRLLGLVDLDWWNLFEMQLSSSRHFVGGKTFLDQLAGYGMLFRSIKLLADKDSYELEDLQKAREILKKYFPAGVPVLNVEGEIFMFCSLFNDVINVKKIPVQTPLNPAFMMGGSIAGAEASIRKRFADILEQVRNGIEVEEDELPVISFPMMRNKFLNLFSGGFVRVYKSSKKAGADLLAGYFLLDLEEYRLMKGMYPADVLELRGAGFNCELPDDVDSGGKVIYLNDGGRAVLYAVGKDGKDDGGYRDGKDADTKRDDVIYWERDLKEEMVQRGQ